MRIGKKAYFTTDNRRIELSKKEFMAKKNVYW